MRRGTTPSHTFTTDIDLTGAEVIYITYKQNGMTVMEREIGDMSISPTEVTVELSQTDTLMFRAGGTVEVQIRARFQDGTAVASNIMTTTANRILKEGVI